jgi:hypothetical protein
MGLELQIRKREKYLYAALVGRFDIAAAQRHVTQIFAECRAYGCASVLADGRGIEGPMSVGERYAFAAALAEAHAAHLAAGHGTVRVAYLGEESQLDPQRLGETVARNRGVDAKSTADPAEAAAWLGIELAEVP